MGLIVTPDDGLQPVIDALNRAKKSIHILIFRFDRSEVEKAMLAAVERGVVVHALIAFTNRGGDKNLRKFEQRLLGHGVTVTRTADDLVRYHGKMFILDEQELYLLAFNYTHMDIRLSRSFAVITSEKKTVQDALALFEADSKRTEYKCGNTNLVVSPNNSREKLLKFIDGAKSELLLYEMQVSDREFINLLNKKAEAGVKVRVLGKKGVRGGHVAARAMPMRLHARAILRDGKEGFLGSMSLRKLELEARREVGLIFDDEPTVQKMIKIFNADWEKAAPVLELDEVSEVLHLPAKKVAKSVVKQMDMEPTIEKVLKRVMKAKDGESCFTPDEVAETMREAFRDQVEEAVAEALRGMVVESAEEARRGAKE